MTVVVYAPLAWSDAGRECALTPGQVYDLPDVVARSLMVRGLAGVADLDIPVAAREVQALGAAPERKGRHRR
jgi:hypothetical protein